MTEEKASASKPVKRLTHLLTNENLWIYILSIAQKNKKVYAYALDSEIESGFGFKPNKIMSYIVLYKLEAEGLISSEYDAEKRRKYYAITPKGNGALESARKYFRALAARL